VQKTLPLLGLCLCPMGFVQKVASSTEEALRRGRNGSGGTPVPLWGGGLLSSGPAPMPSALSGMKEESQRPGSGPLSAIKGQGLQGASLLARDVCALP